MKTKWLYLTLSIVFILAVFCIFYGFWHNNILAIASQTSFHIGIDAFGACICAILLYGCLRNKETASISFVSMVLLTSFSFTLNELMWFNVGNPETSRYYFYMCMASKFLNLLLIFAFYKYIRNSLMFAGKLESITNIAASVLLILSFIAVFSNVFGPISYSVDANGIYHKEAYSFLEDIYLIVMSLLTTVLIITKRLSSNKTVAIRQKVAALSFILIPIVQFALTGGAFAYSTQYASVLLSLIMMYCILFNEKGVALYESQKQMSKIQKHMIDSLASIIEERDLDTGEHVVRTSDYIKTLALDARKDGIYTDVLTDEYIEFLYNLAPLHDVGKIVVSDTILRKPGKLTDEEREAMKEHAAAGEKIIGSMLEGFTDDERVRFAKDIAAYHHEWWDGSGYPNKLKGEEIPLSARLMAIVDVFDALTSKRCYKECISPEKAFKIIEEESGTHFDPNLVKVLLNHKKDFI